MFHYDVTQRKSICREIPRCPGVCFLEPNILDEKGAYLYGDLRILS